MKQLTDADLMEMIGEEFDSPDDKHTLRSVRAELKLQQLIPEPPAPTPNHVRLDLHKKTVETAWNEIYAVLRSGARSAEIITGASGILKPTFEKWITNSIIAPWIVSWKMINRGSYEIKIKKNAGTIDA
ncbi:hypothetical protein LJC18_02380 [Lachnospiraceae bacterium OttesenSCG-928-E19]|nr:hypothetical protein [Lachnospiraceae bacterium OttesenSCG-928-E19]